MQFLIASEAFLSGGRFEESVCWCGGGFSFMYREEASGVSWGKNLIGTVFISTMGESVDKPTEVAQQAQYRLFQMSFFAILCVRGIFFLLEALLFCKNGV